MRTLNIMPPIMLSVNPSLCENRAVPDRRFQSLVDAWLGTFESPNTQAAYRRDLEVFARWASLASVRPVSASATDIDSFREHCLSCGSGAATVSRRLAAVASFYRYAGPGWSQHNPAHDTARPAVAQRDEPDAPSAEAVWRAAGRIGGKAPVIVALVMFEGFKTKDLVVLDVDDVRVTRREVSVDGEAVHPLTAAALRRHVGGRTAGPLLTNESTAGSRGRLTRFGVDYVVKRVGEQAGLATPLTVNALRATHRAARGASTRTPPFPVGRDSAR